MPLPSKLGESYQTYDTAESAVLAALGALRTGNKHIEAGGAVLLSPTGKYAFTQPVGQRDGGHFSAELQIPQGWKLASLYHNHPAGQQSTMFSGDDIAQAKQLGIPSYILSHADNRIRRFDPTSSSVIRSDGTYFSPGALVDEPPAVASTTSQPINAT